MGRADLATIPTPMLKSERGNPRPVEGAPQDSPRMEFRHRARFVWKSVLLFVTFLALIPILLYQDVLGAKVYLWFLIVVHVIGLGIFSWGVTRHDIAPTVRGFVGRLVGLIVVAVLLFLASKGLHNPAGTMIFWGSLFALWAIHTGGLVLLHLRGRSEACPFLPE